MRAKLPVAGLVIAGVLAYACARDVRSPAAPDQPLAGEDGGARIATDPTPCPDPTPTPHPSPTPTPGTGCSPGYWKNHASEFNQWCGSVPNWTCASLWTAITCKGNDSSCRRSAAAAALNAVSGCTE